MSNQNQDETVNCCQNHYPRMPYFHIQQNCDYCCIGCDKPGVGSMEHNPSNNSCNDFALCCCPCSLIADILCCPCMVFGYYTVTNPN